MKFKGKEIKILYVKFKHKETFENRQEQTGSDRNRQEQTVIDGNRQEQTGIYRIRYLIRKIIAS